MKLRGRARSRPARGKCPKTLRKRRPIAAYKQFPERKRRNARARKCRRETEQTKVGGDRTHSADRATKRHTRNGGADLQIYLADRPRRPARARSEIAGSDRAVVCGPPLSACARSWVAAAAAAAAAAVQIRRMALPLIPRGLSTMFTPERRPLKVDKRYLPAILR